MGSVLKFSGTNSRGRSAKPWKILGVAGMSIQVDILAAEGCDLTNLAQDYGLLC